MLFCVVWSDGLGALSPERQRDLFADVGADDRRIVDRWEDMPQLQDGDEVLVLSLLAIAKDAVAFAFRYRSVMRNGGVLAVDGVGTFTSWDQFPEALEAFQKAKGRKQTAKARSKAKPHRGPRGMTKADIEAFSMLWRDPSVTKADLAVRYGKDWTTINRWGKMLKLGEKARRESN